MKLPLYQVDAFAGAVFSGNPAAVVPLEAWLADAQMQNVAAENNLSETAFFVPNADGSFDLRWFTPEIEIPLCGHATLASAAVLFEKLAHSGDEIIFHSKSGELRVRRGKRDGRELYTLDFPARAYERVDTPQAIVNALGVEPLETYRSAMNFMAVLSSVREVAERKPNFSVGNEEKEFFLRHGLITTAAVETALTPEERERQACDAVDFVSRYFALYAGIEEDPVTGSAHCTLTPFWSERLGRKELVARQISKRGGVVYCALTPNERVLLGGFAAFYLEGVITI